MSPPPPAPVSQVFALAFQHHQAGRLAEAEAHYRQVLALQPGHADAWHYLGVVAHQAGRHDLAGQLIRRALELHPDNPAAHSNLGAALAAQGQFEEAAIAYRRAIQLRPVYPEAYLNLGLALAATEHPDNAVAMFRQALELDPGYLEAHYNLGVIQAKRGQSAEAATAFQRALEIKPDYLEALLELGNVLGENGRSGEAIPVYHRALDLQPDCAEAHSNLGSALRNLGQLDEAVAAHRRALEIKPDYAPTLNNLGNALSELGRCEEAIAVYRRALQSLPDMAETYYNLGTTLAQQGHLDDAVAAYRRALELKPDYAEAWANLGNAHKDQGRLEEAVTDYRRAVQLKPEEAWMQSNVVCALHFQPGEDENGIVTEYRRWNEQFSEPRKRFVRQRSSARNPDRRLRIGYVSPDFRHHVIGYNLAPLLRNHDHERFEILCYSGAGRPDDMTEMFRRQADRWRSTARQTEEAIAGMIIEDEVDILVDLTQHLAGNRLTVFARQPAPLQVSFAGYPASTGLEAIGNRISDRYLEGCSELPRGTRERVFLIESFWCYDPCGAILGTDRLPEREMDRITFGSLSNFAKVNEPALRRWARVLEKVTDSRLILLTPEGSHRRRTLEILEGEGIAAQRVEFVEPLPRKAYLELYRRLDIVLDPFPYNGHTTSLDALWMGVPVVSLAGQQAVSRAGLSQLSNLGLSELVACSEDDFVAIATRLARDFPRRAEWRSTLRARMRASPLMDEPRFARGIESAYRTMWRCWCAEEQL